MRRAQVFGGTALSSWLVAFVACGGARPAPVPPAEPSDDEPAEVAGREGDDPEAYPVASNGERSLLDEARRELALVRETRYSHRTHVDEAAGRFDVDCSGFIDYALGRAVPGALDELRAATVRRPLAKHFVQFFTRGAPGRHWQVVADATELEPGDVIAWLQPAELIAKGSRNTGHAMIVREPVHRDAVRGDLVVVPIIDATSVTHGTGDSRRAARLTGLGTGEVLLVIDPSGAPIGYRWSRGSRAHEHHTTIAMGRIR